VHAIERAAAVFDGCVPFMHGHHFLMSDFSVGANALRLLGAGERAAIVDAMDVGGTGDPFAGLTAQQREALAELYRFGFARGGEMLFGFHSTAMNGVMCWLQSEMSWADPAYFDDFWTVPGYLGADDPALAGQIREISTKVKRVIPAAELIAMGGLAARAAGTPDGPPVGVIVDHADVRGLRGSTVQVLTGRGAGRELPINDIAGEILVAVTGPYGFPQLFEGVVPGDEVLLTNRKYIAQCFWSRYHLEGELEYRPIHPWAVDGRPIYPQREHHAFMNMGPDYLYRFEGKMIMIQNAVDNSCWPSGATFYHERLKRNFGERIDEHFRLWWNANADHTPPRMLEAVAPPVPHSSTRLIDYTGSVHQAVQDLMAWVEEDKEPVANTKYEYSTDERLTLASDPAERGGIQPMVAATANGALRADVSVGQAVEFAATARVPGGSGYLIGAEWDFEGDGTWPLKYDFIDGKSDAVELTASHAFSRPGTYFPAIRVTAHRNGDVNATLGRLPNLARVRVVVS
jgi:hypothetical protein